LNGSLVTTGMPLKSEIRPVRSYRGVKVGENPYLTQNTPLFLKATLPQRGRVGVQNKPDQARSKPGTSQEQPRSKPGATQVAPAPLYHSHSPSRGPLDHPLWASRVIGSVRSPIKRVGEGDPKIALNQGKPQKHDGILRFRLPSYSLGEGLKARWRITG
jgi:hypothetical protein